MSNKFKAGDKVKRITGTGLWSKGMTVGNVYTVREVKPHGIQVKEIPDNTWEPDFFELVEEQVPFGKQLFGHKIKVKDEEQSRLIQEAVFEAGGSWCWTIGKRVLDSFKITQIFIGEGGHMNQSCSNTLWVDSPLPELILETVKSLRIVDTVPVKSQADIDKENIQKVIDKLQEDLDNAKQQLNNIR